jgi:tripartite-type tricarboxylate transporter receptor subunit TctC
MRPSSRASLKENQVIMGPKIALRVAVMLTIPIASILSWIDTAAAQTAGQFYVGRSINVIVPYSPGGYYDIGARLLARHFGKHIVGKPNIIVQNQPQAGGIGLANRFASGADNDGTVLGILQRAVPQYAFIGYQSAKFDPLKLNWIGSLSAYETDSYVMVLNAKHPAITVSALKDPAVKTRLGSGRSGSANLIFALVAKQALGLNLDIVRGYEGAAPIFLAEQRGEVDGLFADFSAVKVSAADSWKTKQIVPVVQFGRKTRLPELADVPISRELIKDPVALSFLEFAEMPFFIALPIAGPAGIPADRLKALQDGFMEMAHDQAFLNDAKNMQFEVDPISAAAVIEAIAKAAKTPADVMAQFKALVSQ